MWVAFSPRSKPSLKNERSTLCSSSMLLKKAQIDRKSVGLGQGDDLGGCLIIKYNLTRIVDIQTGISDLGLWAFSSPRLRSCEAAVAPLSRGGTGPVERRTGSPAVARRQSRREAFPTRPAPPPPQNFTHHTPQHPYR